MTLRNSALLLSLWLGAACTTKLSPVTETDSVPPWLATLIEEFKNPPGNNPPDYVARYEYRGQIVYYVAPRCCDIMSVLYDSVGTVLCAPDGGIAGHGDGRCPDFFAERKNERILWRAKSGA